MWWQLESSVKQSPIAEVLRRHDNGEEEDDQEDEKLSPTEHLSLIGRLLSSMTDVLERFTEKEQKQPFIQTPLWR